MKNEEVKIREREEVSYCGLGSRDKRKVWEGEKKEERV